MSVKKINKKIKAETPSKEVSSEKKDSSTKTEFELLNILIDDLKKKADAAEGILTYAEIKEAISLSGLSETVFEGLLEHLNMLDIELIDSTQKKISTPLEVLEDSEQFDGDHVDDSVFEDSNEDSNEESSVQKKKSDNLDSDLKLDRDEDEHSSDAEEDAVPPIKRLVVDGNISKKKEKKTADAVIGRSNDPVRIYLRKMGSVALLSREGEVVIAKKIEACENRILESLLDVQIGLNTIGTAAKKFVDGELRMKSWIKGFDDDEASHNEEAHEQKVKLHTEQYLKKHSNYQLQLEKKVLLHQ